MKKSILFLLLLCSAVAFSQNTIMGKVTDIKGEPLPGASVIEKGTSTGVVTDFNGNYEISVSSKEAVLLISFIGFENLEVQIENSNQIDIELNESAESLNEVTIQGFSGIVGKSRRRTETIQTTPESVTAINSEGIENLGVNNVANFANLVPNLKLNTSQAAGINTLTVRGIPQIRNSDAPVAFVIDGVTVPDPSLLNQELFDLALIEVVKGPQGALYGKNAIGGAINIYTKEPLNKAKHNLKLGAGNGGGGLAQFISSGAIKKDKVFYRASTQFTNFNGLLTNEYLNEKVDFSREFNARAQIIARITDNFKMTLAAQFMNIDAGAAYYSVNPTGNVWVEGEPGGYLDPNPKKGNNIISMDEPGKSNLQNLFTNLNLEYILNNVKIQSVTAYNHVDRSLSGDLDFTPFNDFTQGETADTKTFNQELRFSNLNTDADFNWTAGGFYQKLEKDFFQDGLSRDFDLDELFYGIAADVTNTTSTFAAFGFVDYSISEKFTLSVGLRYDNDTFKQVDHLSGETNERTNNIFQPKGSISFQATKDALIYANYGRGYRTGGYNPATTDRFNREYKDELTNNYELGFKTSWWNNRFILNGSVFYTDYKNQQQYVFDLDTFYAGNYNYDESRIIGFEVDLKVRLFKYLDLLANYGFVDSEISEGGTTGGENGDATDLSAYNGNKTPFVPVDNFNIGLETNFPINDNIDFNANINLNNTGKTYWEENNAPEFTTSAYQLLDARASISFSNMTIAIWGKNILDTQYYTEYIPGSIFGATDDYGWRGRPATYGATFSIDF